MSVAKLSLPACLFGTKLLSRPPKTRTLHNCECLTSELLTKPYTMAEYQFLTVILTGVPRWFNTILLDILKIIFKNYKHSNSYATMQYFSYVTVQKAVSQIKPNIYLAKIDLKSAYHYMPIHPSNYCATGLSWTFSGINILNTIVLYDNKLPFGAFKSPEIFHRSTQVVTRIMARRGFCTILAYLDDFLIIGDS